MGDLNVLHEKALDIRRHVLDELGIEKIGSEFDNLTRRVRVARANQHVHHQTMNTTTNNHTNNTDEQATKLRQSERLAGKKRINLNVSEELTIMD